MASPVVVSRSSGVDDTSQTNHSITLPATLDDGDMVAIFVVMSKNQTTLIWPTGDGWVEVDDDEYVDNDVSYSVGYLISDGSEGGTNITVTTSAANMIAYTMYRITGADSLEAGVAVGATTTTPDPPSFSPSGGSDDYLWIAICGTSWGAEVTAGPSGYTDLTTAMNAGFNDAGIGTAEKTSTASSEDPGTFTMDAEEVSIANTIAVVPAAVGGPTLPYAYDFVGSNGDPWETDVWTEDVDAGCTLDIQSNTGRQLGAGVSADWVTAQADGLVRVQDVQLLLSCDPESGQIGTQSVNIFVRADGSLDSAGFPSDAYQLTFGVSSISVNTSLKRRLGGTPTTRATGSSRLVAGAKFWIRIELEDSGTDVIIRMSAWDDGESEPGSWDIDYTDTAPGALLGAAGYLAIRSDTSSSSTTFDNRFDDLLYEVLAVSGGTEEHTTDALLQATETETHTTDALLQATEIRTHTTDANLFWLRTDIHTTDALLQATEALDHSTDAYLVDRLTQEHTTDALLQATEIEEHTTDALLQATEIEEHTTDALLIFTPQLLAPDEDISGTGWESAPTPAQDLFEQVNEPVADPADYIFWDN